ncbi:GNAT family N-acetyltransferase [Neorhizobium alkalisoli]|uniref:Acetyltransferase (GNAT) family protein n=1 Tax=Neorhizobium alkalisoli TaxID=528178 RepID=A0A561QW90_9HYPH|nr:GNAT family N-acetyltransferase [Neorhizobium alkalisoli]TWF54596.1 acetyltransferase (GNAT) family protein [Neorhizobium alkalisoli]
MTIDLKVTEGIAPQEEEVILDQLRSYNLKTFGESHRRELTIPLYDDEGTITGGLVGYTGRGWLYISMLYIPENLRGQGLATRIMTMADDEARSRGCIGAYIDTMNPDALRLYLKLGYEVIGRLDSLEGGHCVHWLQKRYS